MQTVLTVIFAVIGYLFILRELGKRTRDRGALPLAAAVALAVWLCLLAGLWLVCLALGDGSLALYLLLALLAVCWLAFGVRFLIKNRKTVHKGVVLLLLLYGAAVFYITLLSRSDRGGAVVQTEALRAFRDGSPEDLRHWLLNMAMFMPVGFLFPLAQPEKLGGWADALLNGLAFSTVIEAAQLLFRLGNCDVDDIIANALGAVLGWAVYKLLRIDRKMEPGRGARL